MAPPSTAWAPGQSIKRDQTMILDDITDQPDAAKQEQLLEWFKEPCNLPAGSRAVLLPGGHFKWPDD